jgi:hypothetical protein
LWDAPYPSIGLTTLPALAGADFVSLILTGQAPDVIQVWDISPYRNADYLLPLDEYIQADKLNLDVFVTPMVDKLRNATGQVIGLPAILATAAVAVDLGAVDATGLKRPSPDWDYEEFTALARALYQPNKRLGTTIFQEAAGTGPIRPADFYFRGFGGAYVDPSDASRCGLTGEGAIQCAEWLSSLMGVGIAQMGTVETSLGTSAAMGMVPSWTLVQQAENFGSLTWDYWNMPTWPQGPATFATSNFWAITASSKHPRESWELLKWLAFSQTWARSNIHLFLMSPALKAMWPEWEQTVQALAPPLLGKNVAAFRQLALTDAAYPTAAFDYLDNEAYTAITSGPYGLMSEVIPGTVSPADAFPHVVAQVDAIESQGATVVAAQNKLQTALRAATAGTQFPAPLQSGIGSPVSNGKADVTVSAGAYTLLGIGADVWAGDDDCVFAAVPFTAADGDFRCRVTGWSVLQGTLQGYAKAGLMARGDLSNDAPLVAIEATGANGVFTQNLYHAAGSAQSWPPSGPGAVAAAVLTLSATQSRPNYLAGPIWLRLVRQGLNWTGFTSTDGTTWNQTGVEMPALMGGCWVGVFASPQIAGNETRVTFDHVSFAPLTTFARIGGTA